MTSSDVEQAPKPVAGSIAPVVVAPLWQHVSILVASGMAVIPFVIAALEQLGKIPGLPTNILAWFTTATSVLTALYLAYAKLFGTPQITPTAAAKVIETVPPVAATILKQ